MSRRDIKFEDLEQIIADIQLLESRGYQAYGKWNLSQICEHLADWMGYSMDGFPKMSWVMKSILGVMRMFFGKRMYRDFVGTQRMKESQPTIPTSVHESSTDAKKSVNRLIGQIRRLQNFKGEIHPSPLFGPLNHAEAVALQLAHCAHHLSFLKPQSK